MLSRDWTSPTGLLPTAHSYLYIEKYGMNVTLELLMEAVKELETVHTLQVIK